MATKKAPLYFFPAMHSLIPYAIIVLANKQPWVSSLCHSLLSISFFCRRAVGDPALSRFHFLAFKGPFKISNLCQFMFLLVFCKIKRSELFFVPEHLIINGSYFTCWAIIAYLLPLFVFFL